MTLAANESSNGAAVSPETKAMAEQAKEEANVSFKGMFFYLDSIDELFFVRDLLQCYVHLAGRHYTDAVDGYSRGKTL